MRPIAPAFAVCVCRMCGRSRRTSAARRRAATTSRSGEISRPSCGMWTTGTPRRSATNSIDSSPRASEPATRVVRYPRGARPDERYATWSAGPPMFSRAITRMTRMSPTERLDRQAQTLLERPPRFVSEPLPGLRDVGPRVAHVARAQRQVALLDRLPEDAADRVGELPDARRAAGGDVEDAARDALDRAGSHVRGDDVVHVREVARLRAVSMDVDLLAGRDAGDEERHDGRVLREWVLAGAEDVEVADHDRLGGFVDATEADAVALRRQLRHRVRRDRVGRHRLAPRQVAAVPVDRRGAGEDDAADALVARREQHVQRPLDVHGARREWILDRARDGRERALVEHELDAPRRRVHALVRAQLALHHLDVQALDVGAVPRGEVVQDAHVVAALEQRADEVR